MPNTNLHRGSRLNRIFISIEEWLGIGSLVLLALIPVLQTVLRNAIQGNVPDGALLMRHLILPVTFLGASMASRHRQHLGISLGLESRRDIFGILGTVLPNLLTAALVVIFGLSSFNAVLQFQEYTQWAWFMPLAPLFLFIPLGFLLVLWRQRPHDRSVAFQGIAKASFLLGIVLGIGGGLADLRDLLGQAGIDTRALLDFDLAWAGVIDAARPWLIGLLVVSTFLGTPLFVVLGGIASFLYMGSGYTQFGESMGAAPVILSGYQLIAQDNVPAIALFTFTGFILSESKSGERFVRFFKALFGPIPGGVVIVTILVSAFFTTFTGASGVTILALGGLLYAILMESGHNTDRFSIGLLTASGSIGLLFAPSLAIILYGSVSLISISQLFLAGILPGLLLLIGMGVGGYFLSHRSSLDRATFNAAELLASFKGCFLELLLPMLIAVLYFTGICTLSETAAWAALYALAIETLVHREINVRTFRHLAVKSLVIIGGVLIILAVARGLSAYLADNGIPAMLADWMVANVSSPLVFLLFLNLTLFVVGCFMDLFSAILIIVPLISPVALAYGIDPRHLAMIFLVNLGVGFLTPPVGMNLFLASFRFNRPLVKLYRDILPFLLIQIVVTLLVTYIPWLSTAFLPPMGLAPQL